MTSGWGLKANGPLGDGSIVCSISYWEEPDNIDIQKLCDTFIGAMEIK